MTRTKIRGSDTKAKKRVKKSPLSEKSVEDHRRDFNQLLDDAVFGVKKKPQRG